MSGGVYEVWFLSSLLYDEPHAFVRHSSYRRGGDAALISLMGSFWALSFSTTESSV